MRNLTRSYSAVNLQHEVGREKLQVLNNVVIEQCQHVEQTSEQAAKQMIQHSENSENV